MSDVPGSQLQRALHLAATLGLMGLLPLASASAQLVSLGDGGLLDTGLLGAEESMGLQGSATATAHPPVVAPGETVTITYDLDGGELLTVRLDALSCTLTFPDGRVAPLCTGDSTGLTVNLLGAGDDHRTIHLRAPATTGTYEVRFDAGPSGIDGSQDASTVFDVEPAGEPLGLYESSAQAEPSGPTTDGTERAPARASPGSSPEGVAWLIEHPWVLVAIAAAVSAFAFSLAARASPAR